MKNARWLAFLLQGSKSGSCAALVSCRYSLLSPFTRRIIAAQNMRGASESPDAVREAVDCCKNECSARLHVRLDTWEKNARFVGLRSDGLPALYNLKHLKY